MSGRVLSNPLDVPAQYQSCSYPSADFGFTHFTSGSWTSAGGRQPDTSRLRHQLHDNSRSTLFRADPSGSLNPACGRPSTGGKTVSISTATSRTQFRCTKGWCVSMYDLTDSVELSHLLPTVCLPVPTGTTFVPSTYSQHPRVYVQHYTQCLTVRLVSSEVWHDDYLSTRVCSLLHQHPLRHY